MKTPQERKAANEQYIREHGIGVFEGLPMVPSANEVTVKDFPTVCKRAVAALLSTQIACEISQEQYGNVHFFTEMMDKFGVKDALNTKEQKLVSGMFDRQDVVDVMWEYECYWSLVWALGLLDDIRDASAICDCAKAVGFVSSCQTMEDFQSKCRLRDTEEILDLLDLYYRYHWACVQHEYIDKNLPIGSLNTEVVYERRRGLEWFISEESDWHDIVLHT